MYKYETIIYWSETDCVFVAEIPDLPGCLAHGETPTEALHNVGEAIELWLETAAEFGDKIPEPKQHQLAA